MNNLLPQFDQVLLIAGTGRNSGKTTLVSTICLDMPKSNKPVCIKISNHFHDQPGAEMIISNSHYRIFEETQVSSGKDTARMLAAGASRVFFIEAEGEFTFEAFLKIQSFLLQKVPVICESGGLRNYMKPAKFIMLHTAGNEVKPSAKPLIPLADLFLESAEGELEIKKDMFRYENQTWHLNA